MATLESSPDAGRSEWNLACPQCGAEVQAVARRCWKCGADIPAGDFDESEYRPGAMEPEAVEGLSVSLIVVLAFAIPLAVLGFIVYALMRNVLGIWF